ncbi:MAG: hypothetical protein J6Q03_10560 [Paludibacteraceae bacterium]|nr:hypothetical protein [Paludibacteraceae bacterium]
MGVLYTYCNVPIAIGVFVRQWHHREYAGVVINTSVGRALLVSTDMAIPTASNREASNKSRASRFFYA